LEIKIQKKNIILNRFIYYYHILYDRCFVFTDARLYNSLYMCAYGIYNNNMIYYYMCNRHNNNIIYYYYYSVYGRCRGTQWY